MRSETESFRRRLKAGTPLIGTFVKTPSPIVCEALAKTRLDLFCLDVEHAPFGRLELDLCLAALRALGRPSLVRVASDSPHDIRNALDSGASGILVPHVTTADQAGAIVRAAHFGEGGRGFAGSTRAAEFTTRNAADHLADSREHTTVIVQVEDLAALDNVADIAGVDGVDGIFIGRADLAVAMGKTTSDAAVIDAVQAICHDAAGTCVGMFTPMPDEIPDWRRAGASLFLLSSDQSLMLAGANAMADRFREQIAT